MAYLHKIQAGPCIRICATNGAARDARLVKQKINPISRAYSNNTNDKVHNLGYRLHPTSAYNLHQRL